MHGDGPHDYYALLEIERTATIDEVKRAYRKLAVQHHPDRNPGDADAEEMFKRCTEAYQVLSDADKRAQYDRLGDAAFRGAAGGSTVEPMDFSAITEMLEGLLGDMFRGARAKKSSRVGEDIQIDLSVSFEEAALGTEKKVDVPREVACGDCGGTGAAAGSRIDSCPACSGSGEVRYQKGFFAASRTCMSCAGSGRKVQTPCPSCSGIGTTQKSDTMNVKVPPGVENGAVRTVRGAGKRGPAGPGDLHVNIRVDEHPLFTREGADIVCTVPISFPQAVLGAQLDVPTLEGRVNMKLPPGTQPGKTFRLRGKGLPTLGGAGKGDQLVRVLIEVPTEVTKKQRKLIEDLAAELGTESHPQQASFVGKLKRLFDA
jgi:molecular chaperone DnaJ